MWPSSFWIAVLEALIEIAPQAWLHMFSFSRTFSGCHRIHVGLVPCIPVYHIYIVDSHVLTNAPRVATGIILQDEVEY